MAQHNNRYEFLTFKLVDDKMKYFGFEFKNRKAFIHIQPNFENNITVKQALKVCEMLTFGLILMHSRGLNEGTIRSHMAPILKDIKPLLHSNIAQHLPDGVIDNFIKNKFKHLYDDIESKHPSITNTLKQYKI